MAPLQPLPGDMPSGIAKCKFQLLPISSALLSGQAGWVISYSRGTQGPLSREAGGCWDLL